MECIPSILFIYCIHLWLSFLPQPFQNSRSLLLVQLILIRSINLLINLLIIVVVRYNCLRLVKHHHFIFKGHVLSLNQGLDLVGLWNEEVLCSLRHLLDRVLSGSHRDNLLEGWGILLSAVFEAGAISFILMGVEKCCHWVFVTTVLMLSCFPVLHQIGTVTQLRGWFRSV